jgi:hypothetical protein
MSALRIAKVSFYFQRAPVCALIFAASGCALKTGKQARQEVAPLYSASSPEFRQSAGSLLGPNFVSGNNIHDAGQWHSNFSGHAQRNSLGQTFD